MDLMATRMASGLCSLCGQLQICLMDLATRMDSYIFLLMDLATWMVS